MDVRLLVLISLQELLSRFRLLKINNNPNIGSFFSTCG